MRKIYQLLAVLCCLFVFINGYSQVSYSENFDATNGGWTSTGATWSQTTNDPCTGAGSVRANLWSSSTTSTFRSPLLPNSNGGVITLNFNYKILDYVFPGGGPATPNSPAWGSILVQYGSSTTGPWTTVHTIDPANHIVASTCAAKNITFSPPSGDLYIRFSATWSGGDYYIHIDDMNITQGAAPACATPTNISSSALTTTGATISWDASTTGTATGYQWEIRTSGAAGSGATGLVASGNTTSSTLTATTTALAANTNYSVYVRTNCGGGTFSGWAGPHTFNTPCTTATLPYIQDFESATTPALPNCTAVQNAGTGNMWYTSPSPGSGFTSKALRYSYNSTNAANAWFYTQPVSLTAGTSYRISYKYGNNSTLYVEKMKVMYGIAANSTDMTELIADHTNIAGGVANNVFYDFTPSTTGVYYFGFNAYSIADQDQLFLDDIRIMVTPTCDEPTALIFSGITTNSVQLEWTPPVATSPVNYQIYHSTSNVAPTGSTTPTISGASSPATIASLTPGTKYYVWVRSNCGAAGTSIWTNRDSVTTECTPVTTLNENFDAVTTPALPACWGKLLRGTAGAPNVVSSTASVNSAPNAVLLSNNSSTATADIMLVSPPLSNLGAGTHRLKFWARNTTATQDIEVGTLDNKTSTGTFTLVQAVDINTTYAEYIVDFTGVTTTDLFIAIRRLSTSTFTSVYIDNFVWEVIPVCDAPTLPTFANITSTGAEVSWTPPTIGSPVNYQIYYSTTNTAPTGASTPNVTGASSPANITGLTPNTQYYLWIRTNCGAGGLSAWSAMASFRTACTPVSVLPWSENFDALVTIGTNNFPDCWKKENGDWRTSDAAFATQNNPRSAPNYLTNAWSATNEFMWTPGFQLAAGTSYDFSFWWVGDGYSGWTGDVFYNGTQSSTGATQLGSSFVTSGTTTAATYAQVKESFVPSTTGVYYFAIRINANATPWYLGFDDFNLRVTPTCAEPTALTISNLTTTTAQLNWTAPATGSPVNYQVYLASTNTAPTAGSTPTLSGQTAPSSLTALTANTTYYVWVRSNCGGSDVSAWAGPVTFTTLCNPATLPYTQNFESATTPNMPACTMTENAGTGNNWITATAPGSGFTTKALRYIYHLSNAANAWFYTQGLSLTGGVSYRVSYKYGNNSTFYTEKLEVKYGTSPASASMTNLIADHPSIIGGTPSTVSYDFTPATTGVYFIGFHAYSIANQDGLFVDDISVIATPTCNEPTGVTSNPTTTTAQISWTAPTVGTPASYQIYYSTTNTAPTGSTTPNVTGITGTTTNLTGLTANTTYYLWMRSFCGGTDNSIWTATPIVFTTLCTAVTNFAQNFDALTAPAMPSCWNKVGTTGTINTQTANNNSAPNTMYIYSSSATDIAMVSLPPVTNLATGINTLRFKARGNLTAGAIIQVGYLATPGNAASFTLIQAVTISTLTYQDYVITIPALPSGTQVLALRHTGAPALSVLIDNVEYNAALPVTLIDFRGEKAGSANKLVWTTSTEINNRGFELERSADGRNFTAITFIVSKAENGNSNAILNYSFNDARPLSGNNYYRLKQIDRDGKTTYSDMVELKSKVSEITISSVYPNPATSELKLIITSPAAEKVTIVVTDLTGKVIMQQATQLVIGDNLSQMKIQQLAAGTYLIKAICANGCETTVQRFVKH